VNLGSEFIALAEEYNLIVFSLETMCSLLRNADIWQINKYEKNFGNWFHLILNGDPVLWYYPLMRSPCGPTDIPVNEQKGQVLD
jgi:hypothetical protein